jgi:hypothetical protein
MKLRLRKAKGSRGALEHRLLSPETVESNGGTNNANTGIAFWNNSEVASPAISRFTNTFSIDFPEEDSLKPVDFPDESLDPRTNALPPEKEPVWKKRLRVKTGAPAADGVQPPDKSKAETDNLIVKEIISTIGSGDDDDQETWKKRGKGKKGPRKVPLKSERETSSSRREAMDKESRKKKVDRQSKEEVVETHEDEESFNQLVRPSSTLSDMLSLSFLDEDFSLGTPTIYTDSSEDKSSISSDSIRRDHRHRRRQRSSRTRTAYDDDRLYSCADDDFLEFGLLSCRVSEQLKVLADVLNPEENCACADGQDTVLRVCEADSSRSLTAGRRRKSRRQLAMPNKVKPDSRRLV